MTASIQTLESLLRPLAARTLGTGFEVACSEITENVPLPLGGIPRDLLGAGDRRLATFRAGRFCAGMALDALGFPVAPIPMGAAGEPLWPSGLVGSISHTDRLAAAVVARTPPFSGLGLDIDEDKRLDNYNMLDLICRPEEITNECDACNLDCLQLGKLIFVIKEAVYKLHRPLGGAFLDFHDVLITLDHSHNHFLANLLYSTKQGSAGNIFEGDFIRGQGLIIALTAHPVHSHFPKTGLHKID